MTEIIYDDGPWLQSERGLLEVSVPSSWGPADRYDFDWSALRSTTAPFQQYPF